MNMHVAIDISIRRSIEDAIERLLNMLDAIDGDPDLEEGGDDELDDCDLEEGGDAEPSLGRLECFNQGAGTYIGCQDMELDRGEP